MSMFITGASQQPHNGRVFYIQGSTGNKYMVRYVRQRGVKRFVCSCPDFFIRRQFKHEHCKHIRGVQYWARLRGGIAKLANSLIKRELTVSAAA